MDTCLKVELETTLKIALKYGFLFLLSSSSSFFLGQHPCSEPKVKFSLHRQLGHISLHHQKPNFKISLHHQLGHITLHNQKEKQNKNKISLHYQLGHVSSHHKNLNLKFKNLTSKCTFLHLLKNYKENLSELPIRTQFFWQQARIKIQNFSALTIRTHFFYQQEKIKIQNFSALTIRTIFFALPHQK